MFGTKVIQGHWKLYGNTLKHDISSCKLHSTSYLDVSIETSSVSCRCKKSFNVMGGQTESLLSTRWKWEEKFLTEDKACRVIVTFFTKQISLIYPSVTFFKARNHKAFWLSCFLFLMEICVGWFLQSPEVFGLWSLSTTLIPIPFFSSLHPLLSLHLSQSNVSSHIVDNFHFCLVVSPVFMLLSVQKEKFDLWIYVTFKQWWFLWHCWFGISLFLVEYKN